MTTDRRGRPPGTSRRALELVALGLFAEKGFEETTVEEIAAHAGVSTRTFFRYFPTKADALWYDFDSEVEALRSSLSDLDESVPLMSAIHSAVLSVNRYGADDVVELRTRMQVVNSSPALQATAALRYDAWERVVADYAGRRLAEPADALRPLVIGRTTLAACRAAYDRWTLGADADLTVYLDEALDILESGLSDEPTPEARPSTDAGLAPDGSAEHI